MNPDTAVTYLGINLRSPFVIGASPLSQEAGDLLALERAGAGAVVMHSLFEEQLSSENSAVAALAEDTEDSFSEASGFFPESCDYTLGPEQYLSHLRALKSKLAIPVIASLNGCTPGGWTGYAREIERAGADALELNIYELPGDPEVSGGEIERRLVSIVGAVREATSLPLAVKLSPFYSSIPNLALQLSGLCQGLVLFNRFYQPDMAIEDLAVEPRLFLSTSSELNLRLRWIATLYGRLPVSLAVTGGVHSATDAVKAVMAGADIVQVVSFVLRNGIEAFGAMVRDFSGWMTAHEYSSVSEMRGALSLRNCPDPTQFGRANYLRTLQLWRI